MLITENVIFTPFLPLVMFEKHLNSPQRFKIRQFEAAGNKDITIVNTGMGADAVSNAVSVLEGSACKNIVFVGACGGINSLDIGDLVLAEQACDKNASSQPDEKLFKKITGFLKLKNIGFKTARIFSADNLVDNDANLIAKLKSGGFSGVELEITSFYNAAKSQNISAAALVYVTDIPLTKPFGTIFCREDKEKISKASATAVNAAIDFLKEGRS